MLRSKRGLSFGFTVAAAVLALASAAFACTTFKGTTTLSATNGTTTAIGNNAGMTYCSLAPGAQGTVSPTGSFTVNVAPTTATGCPAVALADGLYYVNFHAVAFKISRTGAYTINVDCMNSGLGWRATKIGELTLASGSGSGTYTIPSGQRANSANNSGGVCVAANQSQSKAIGIQVPISLI